MITDHDKKYYASSEYFNKCIDSVDSNTPSDYRKILKYFDCYDMTRAFKDGWNSGLLNKWNSGNPPKGIKFIILLVEEESVSNGTYNTEGELCYLSGFSWVPVGSKKFKWMEI